MSDFFQNNTRVFGKDFTNIFNFMNNAPNKTQFQNPKDGNPIQVFKKSKTNKNAYSRRNTMYIKISSKNNIENVDKPSLFVIKEEKENNPNSRKTMIEINDSNAITKSAVVKKKKKEEKIEIKDYFHALIDDYGDDIFRYLIKNEKLNVCDYSKKDIFKLQDKKYFNEKNRSILFHWLVKNNNKWKLKDDTIFMAMNIMDRYISKYPSKNSEFQLIAISSYFIASKYEDIYPPYLDELSQICNYIYSNEDIIKKEYEILVGLNFDILYNSSYKYLTFLHSIAEKEKKGRKN